MEATVPAVKPDLPVFVKALLAAEKDFIKAYGESNPDVRTMWVREAEWARQAILVSNDLQKCSPASIKNAIVNVALTGATLNPMLKEADLIARKGVACLDFRYGGLIRIAVEAGAVRSMNAFVVYDCDEFDYNMGEVTKYKPSMSPPFDPDLVAKDPAEFWKHVVCAFSKAVLPGGMVEYQILPKWKLLKVRETSMSRNSDYSPWKKWPEEMARKTVIKYASKTLKGYGQSDRLARAVQFQNDIDGIEAEKPRDNGSELEKRMGMLPAAPQGAMDGISEAQEANASAEGLSGPKLALWEKVAEMAAGDVFEMTKIVNTLSGGSIKDRDSLMAAADKTVQAILDKIGGKK